MQRIRLKTFLILFPVLLLFCGAVSSDTAPQTYLHPDLDNSNAPFPDTQLLSAIDVLERQGDKEAEMIEALNKRIARLEQKIAALNSAVIEQRQPIQTIQIEDTRDNQRSPAKIVTTEPGQIMVGSATTQPHQETINSPFDMEHWRTMISPFSPYLIPASAGLLAVLILYLTLRVVAAKRSKKTAPIDEDALVAQSSAATATAAGRQNPIATDEKNAMLAQKLAALRSAVEQGKQRRQKQE
ncbi:hypothetical protein [Nitrosomonas sp.]|uniref:hypothetical protein n=1 Tax=Nitrosomonas sp. TaxID=42353 RepID=UPI0028427014|nr:hypothetical protein [Nitrosomonas sp.]MDR4513865.1 hypothetical protein [Nitrosomonas sp.]